MAKGAKGKPDTAEPRLEIWDRGQGYPRDERGLPKEGSKAFEKFRHFLSLGPRRTKVATAHAFSANRASISELASKYRWDERAAAWDEAHGLAFSEKTSQSEIEPDLPERLQAVASQPPDLKLTAEKPDAPSSALALNPVEDRIRAKELEHERMLEEFRAESEALGRRQMQIARGMTSIVGNSVAQMLKSQETLSARAIPGFISAACTLAAAAHHTWGRSIGVDRLLLQMERAVAELEQRTIEDAEVIG